MSAYILALITLAGVITRQASEPKIAGRLVVANQFDHTVEVVDLASRKLLGKVTVGINGHEVVASADGKLAYVPIYSNVVVGQKGTDGDHVDIVDLKEFKVLGSIFLGKGVRPHRALIGPDGLLYVTAELDKSLYAVDLSTRKVVAQIPSGQIETHMFVFSKDGERAYTSNIGAGSVSVLDIKKRELLTVIPVAKSIQRISISPDGRTVFTHDQQSPRVAMIDTHSNKVTGWIEVPHVVFSSAPTPDGKWLIALSPGGHQLYIISLRTFKVTRTFDLADSPMAICISPNGATAFVSCINSGKIVILELKTWEMRPSIQLSPGADGMAWVES